MEAAAALPKSYLYDAFMSANFPATDLEKSCFTPLRPLIEAVRCGLYVVAHKRPWDRRLVAAPCRLILIGGAPENYGPETSSGPCAFNLRALKPLLAKAHGVVFWVGSGDYGRGDSGDRIYVGAGVFIIETAAPRHLTWLRYVEADASPSANCFHALIDTAPGMRSEPLLLVRAQGGL